MTPQEFKQIRTELGLSQAQLGQLMGMTARAISALETYRKPTMVHAAFIRYIQAHP